MARPSHVPEPTWVQCDTRVAQARGTPGDAIGVPFDPSLLDKGASNVQGAMAMAPAAALVLAVVGSQVSRAIAPDAATAEAWSWNHTMRACLEDVGIRLP
jgi:hypothetical protein